MCRWKKVKRKTHCTRNCKHDWRKIASTGNRQGQESALPQAPQNSTTTDFNRKAWMTSAIFERYIQKLDRKFTRQKRKIALILDKCTAHPHISNLDSIKLVFLPPNTTATCQPMDAGVILSQSTLQEQLG